MASTGFTLPGNHDQILDGGDVISWQNSNAIEAEAGYSDSESFDEGDETKLIYGYDYGFSIPVGATITGVEVKVTRYRRDDSEFRTRTTKTKKVTLMDGASTTGNDNKGADTVDWAQDPATETITYGGSSDLWGTGGLTRADVESSDFGAGISAKGVAPCTNSNAYLKFIKINVHYSVPGGEFKSRVIC